MIKFILEKKKIIFFSMIFLSEIISLPPRYFHVVQGYIHVIN